MHRPDHQIRTLFDTGDMWIRLALLRLALLGFGLLSIAVILELSRPDVLLIGNVTIDLVEGNRRTVGATNSPQSCSSTPHHYGPHAESPIIFQGGAVSYAAAVLTALGLRACVVTGGVTIGSFGGAHWGTNPSNGSFKLCWNNQQVPFQVPPRPSPNLPPVVQLPFSRRAGR